MKSRTSVDEYLLLQKKTRKLELRWNQQRVSSSRIGRKIRAFKRRMREIEKDHKERGLPHPEAFSQEAQVKQQQFRKNMETMAVGMNGDPSQMKTATNPDGTLYTTKEIAGLGGLQTERPIPVNADGTLFETPVLPGAVLDKNIHSQEKLDEYLKRKDD